MIRNWLRSWLGIVDPVRCACPGHKAIEALESEMAKQELVHSQEIQELRDRLDMPAKRKPSGRPFAVLAKIAELGAQKQNAG